MGVLRLSSSGRIKLSCLCVLINNKVFVLGIIDKDLGCEIDREIIIYVV